MAVHEMLSEIRDIGYDYHYFADIKFRKIDDTRVMAIMLKYYEKMESIFSKADLLAKINPTFFPEVRDVAMNEYFSLSPLDKMNITDFQKIIVRGRINDSFISKLFDLMETPDNYASLFVIRKRLLQKSPDKLKNYSLYYS